MLKRIKLLTLLQLSDRFKFKKVENKKILIAKIAMMIFGLVLITAICALLVYLLCDIIDLPKKW